MACKTDERINGGHLRLSAWFSLPHWINIVLARSLYFGSAYSALHWNLNVLLGWRFYSIQSDSEPQDRKTSMVLRLLLHFWDIIISVIGVHTSPWGMGLSKLVDSGGSEILSSTPHKLPARLGCPMQIVQRLGLSKSGRILVFPLRDWPRSWVDELLRSHGIDGDQAG
jgi:hypothetical protein